MTGLTCALKRSLALLVFSLQVPLFGQVPPNLFSSENSPPKEAPGGERSSLFRPSLPKALELTEKQKEERRKQKADPGKLKQDTESQILLIKSFVKPNPEDGELRKLQRERLSAAILLFEVMEDQFENGTNSPLATLDQMSNAVGHVVSSAMDFNDSKELMFACLQLAVNCATRFDIYAQTSFESGQCSVNQAAFARYQLRTAEIELFKFKRDNPSKK